MIAKMLTGLLVMAAVTVGGFAVNKSLAAKSVKSCCYEGSPCCVAGSPCCGDTAAGDCCYPGSPCCEPGVVCCDK
jgi:hypothetical protein